MSYSFILRSFKNTRWIKYLTILLLGWLLQACAAHQVVKVNAITDGSQNFPGKTYVLVSGMPQTPENDLYFQEFSRYFDYVLQKNGYTKTKDINAADLSISLSYNVSDPSTGIYNYSWPIYETYGGYSYTITETVTDGNGQQSTVKRNIYVPARTYRVGTEHETRSYTVYSHNASLVAKNAKLKDSEKPPLWSISIQAVDNNNDLRNIMPYLATAAKDYIGNNSGKQQDLEISGENPLLMELRSLVATPKPQ